ncbi:MAG: ABC transporter ATP-binding protein [Christensenellales bacterium]
MSVLSIKNYTKYYEEFKAVDDLSLEIEAGEICAFIGHNGAGKTTTLKACAGILEFNKGEILIDGMSIKENPLECKKIMAYLPDNPDLYEVLTGVKYLNFVSDVYGVNPEDRKARIKELANLLGVYDNLPQPISTYSHGMKQKLAIISALVHKPKLLMMDEPFVGLDPTATHHLKNFMKELCKEGSAIFFSTHVLEVAEKLCDKVAIIKKGKLVASGTMEEVKGKTSLEDVFLELESQPEAAVNGGSK